MEEMGPWKREPGLDKWETRHGSEQTYCSFCGSMNPVLFLSLLREGGTLGPTDKNYKVYIGPADRATNDKFYFMHLDEAQKHEFIALLNMKPRPFKIEYPGKFYVLPYFIEMGPKSEGR
jgi:hypothetical protein